MKRSVKSKIKHQTSARGFGRAGGWLDLRLRISFVTVAAMLLGIANGRAEQTNAPGRWSYDSFRMISDRNIFNPNRVARGGSRTSRSATTPVARVESFSLVGILSYEKGLFAFFEGTSADFKKVLQAGAVIGQYKVASVTADAVKLTLGTNDFMLKVGMQMRREDEGDWFLSVGGEGSSRRRAVFSRSLTNGEPENLTTTNGTEVAGNASEPEVVGVEGEPATNPPAGEPPPATAGTTTDPVLLRLMQRRQEMNQ